MATMAKIAADLIAEERREARQWTVISYDEDTGQVLGDLVEDCADEWEAFAAVRVLRADTLSLITFIAAIQGKHMVCPPSDEGNACVAIDYPEPI